MCSVSVLNVLFYNGGLAYLHALHIYERQRCVNTGVSIANFRFMEHL